MRISHFFIDRPIFASVVAIVFVFLGGVEPLLGLATVIDLLPDHLLARGHRLVDGRHDVALEDPEDEKEGNDLEEERRVRDEEVRRVALSHQDV